LQYPVQRDALQHQTSVMVTMVRVNQTPTASGMIEPFGTDLAV